MQTETAPETLPIEAGDAEWVADLFDTFRAGDVDAVVDQLDELVRVMRKAAKARRMLATVEPSLLRLGLVLCNSRTGASR
jgi:hypothetical protein